MPRQAIMPSKTAGQTGNGASLMRFSYRSRLVGHAEPQALRAIGHSTWRNNQRFNITGFLQYDDGEFYQELEGDPEWVTLISAAILADARHYAISVAYLDGVEARHFDGWRLEGFDRLMVAPTPRIVQPDGEAGNVVQFAVKGAGSTVE